MEDSMHRTLSILSIMSLGIALTARADEPVSVGDVFQARGGGTPVFTVERGWRGTGEHRVRFERYKNHDGKIVAAVDANYETGRLSASGYEQNQSGETVVIVIKDGKVIYSHTQDGKTKMSTEKDSGDMVPFCANPDVITAKWDDLRAGRALEFKVPIHSRRESYTYKVMKQRTWSRMGRSFTEFRMESPNPLIRSLSDPFYFVFDDQRKSLVEYRGSVAAMTGTPGNLKSFQARILYRPADDSGR
jgi:hypothetical protein